MAQAGGPMVPFAPSHFLSFAPSGSAAAASKADLKRRRQGGSTTGLKALSSLLQGNERGSGHQDSWLEKREKDLKAWAAQTAQFANRGSWKRLNAGSKESLNSNGSSDQADQTTGRRPRASSLFLDRISPLVKPLSLPDFDDDLPIPPSPVPLPGAWPYDFGGSSGHDAGLSLPPPFLDETSTAESFDGLLGIRRARESALARRRLEQRLARDRPPELGFPASLLSTAGKLVGSIAPPASGAHGQSKESRRRRRKEDGERALKGLELGDRLAGKVAKRLRRSGDQPALLRTISAPVGDETSGDARSRAAAAFQVLTPSSLFAQSASSSASSEDVTPVLTASPTPMLPLTPSPTTSDRSLPKTTRPTTPRLGPVLNSLSSIALRSSGFFSPLALDEDEQAATTQEVEEPMTAVPRTPSSVRADESSDDDYFRPKLRHRRRQAARFALNPPLSQITEGGTPLPASTVPSGPLAPRPGPSRRKTAAITFLIGPQRGDDEGLISVGGLLGCLLWLSGFAYFVGVHVASLAWSAIQTVRTVGLFLYWVILNVAGRTDLGKVAREYVRLCRKEWDEVAREDGERLGVWALGKGLAEVAAIQAMTKARYLSEGPLDFIDVETEANLELLAELPVNGVRRKSGGSTSRRHRSDSLTDEGDRIIITSENDSIMEGTVFTPEFEKTNPFSAATKPSPLSQPSMDEDLTLTPLSLGGAMNAIDGGATGLSSPPMTPLVLEGRLIDSPKAGPVQPSLEPLDLLRALKRHCRLATASYGLHSYILHPPTPVFTPSGATLPNSIFTHLSKISDRSSVLHVAIQKDYVGAWGGAAETSSGEDEWAPTVFIVRDHGNKEVVVVFRGTQSLHDIVTDLQAGDEQLVLPSLNGPPEERHYSVHGGIYRAVRRLLEPTAPLFGKVKSALDEHTGYSLVLTGHSLGAACASTAAILLSTARTLDSQPSAKSIPFWTTSETSGLPVRPIHAVCFAAPTTVDAALAARCGLGSLPLVVSVSYSSDIVCRIGTGQIKELRRALGRLARSRRGKPVDRTPTNKDGEEAKVARAAPSTRPFPGGCLRQWMKWRRLVAARIAGPLDASQTKDLAALEAWAWDFRRAVLTCSGEPEYGNGAMLPPGQCFHVDQLRADKESPPSAGAAEEGDDGDEPSPQLGFYRVTDPKTFFATPWLDTEMVSSHLPRCYLDAIESL